MRVAGSTKRALPQAPHALPADEVLANMGVSVAMGLGEGEARQRQKVFGPNTIASKRKISGLTVFLHQCKSPVVYLLGAAAALALYFGEWEEGAAIAAVLALNALIGFLTEVKAARSIEALRSLGAHTARVRRDGYTRSLPAEQLVPGDIVLVEAGDSVPADLRLIEAFSLGADESTLTGESAAVYKAALPVAIDTGLAERTSMLFKGTAVIRGSGVGVVVAAGLHSELGRISRLVEKVEPDSSPLERKLARLSGQLVWATLIIAALIIGFGLASGRETFLMVEAGIALAVAAIPEGLPIVATLALARGMWRMARQNALIERLSAVETLGATTIVLTDKTGTLTENRMAVRQICVPAGEIKIDTAGFHSDVGLRLQLSKNPQLRCLLNIVTLCNDATLGGTIDEDSGDPMELAFLRIAHRAEVSRSALLNDLPLVHKHAFDAAEKMMATVHREDHSYLFAIKGAPEVVIERTAHVLCDDGSLATFDTIRAEWLKKVEQLGREGMRVLACALKRTTSADVPPFADLVFVGLIALEDPARTDVPEAIHSCQQAGIRVVMVTGDHAITARSLARRIGIGEIVFPIRGKPELTQLASAKLATANIFARVSPADKLELVRAFQVTGEIVAMTGDGINDAPALRQADIGIAMGRRGTDVAREAAAMVLLDDAFSTIVTAIREGRVIFGNIRQFVAYLMSCNLTEILVGGLSVISSLPLPILPLQILYLNLVTDVFPAFALAMGEGEQDVLQRPPRHPAEPILGRIQWLTIFMHSIVLTVGTLGALVLSIFWLKLDYDSVVTVAFLTLAFAELWHVFNMRHPDSGVLENEVTRSPWVWASLILCAVLLVTPTYLPSVAEILHLVRPDLTMWALIFVMSLLPLFILQIVLLIARQARYGRLRAPA
jgi:Ca2+-transporting ATPase